MGIITTVIPNWLVGIGTFLGGIAAIIAAILGLEKVIGFVMSTDECLFGQEAKDRYERIKDSLPTKHPYTYGPCKWEGGQDFNFMFEVKKIGYDSKTMGAEWKGCKKSIRYVYRDEASKQLMIKGWRIK